MRDRRPAGADTLRRLRLARGWSWTDQAGRLRTAARSLRFARIGTASLASIKRSISRWENGNVTPGEQYQVLLCYIYAYDPSGTVALGPGSDFAELLSALSTLGVSRERLTDVATTVTAAATETGVGLLAFLSRPISKELTEALADPDQLDLDVLDGLAAASDTVNAQIGSVPFVRLHLAQAAVVESARHLLSGQQSDTVRQRLRQVASSAYALAARLAFETYDDPAALALYEEAVSTTGDERSRRALIRTSQTMVVYYTTGDIERARTIADHAVKDARQGPSTLLRARAHALQAEMAARADQPRHAHAALHLAWHDLDSDGRADPYPDVFSKGRLRGFEGITGIFIGEAATAERQLAQSASTLSRPREAVQRAIVLTDRALARLRTGGPGAAETAAAQLHECIDLTSATRARVPAQRLRQVRIELKPWRSESFVADLDDHIHTAFVGL